jgi:hypothetical protein
MEINLPLSVYDTDFESKLLNLIKSLSIKENRFGFNSYESIAKLIGEKIYNVKENPREGSSWGGKNTSALSDDPWSYLCDGILFEIDIKMLLAEDIITGSNYRLEFWFKNNNSVKIEEVNELGDQFSVRMKKIIKEKLKFDLSFEKSMTWKQAVEVLMKLNEIRNEELFTHKILFEIPKF